MTADLKFNAFIKATIAEARDKNSHDFESFLERSLSNPS